MARRFIIERYVIRESVQNSLAVIAVLVLIYISNRFVRYLAEAAAGELDSGVIFELLALKVTANIVVLLPLAVFLGVLLALGRLYRDSEVIAMHAGGVGVPYLARAIGVMGCAFAVLVAVLSMVIAPMAANSVDDLTRRARSDSEVTGLYPGQFKDFGDGDHIIYVRDINADKSEMTGVFVQMRGPTGVDIVYAESGKQFIESRTGDRFMVLGNGYRYEGAPGDADFVIHAFEKHGVRIKKKTADAVERKLESMTVGELLSGSTVAHVAELQWRVSMPIAAVLLAVLAVPLSRTSPGGGRFAKIFTAVLVYFLYSNVLSILYKAVERGDLSPYVGVWPAHLVLAIAVGLLISRGSLGRRMRILRFGRRASVS
jgi:lipopolysaccharide export system permease protein